MSRLRMLWWRLLFFLLVAWIHVLVLRCWLLGGDHRALRLDLLRQLQMMVSRATRSTVEELKP